MGLIRASMENPQGIETMKTSSTPLAYQFRSLLGRPLRRRLGIARRQFLDAAREDCRGAQRALLRDLLQLNGDSDFSRENGLHPGMSLEEYRRRIPVSDYEFFRPWIERVANGNHAAFLGRKNRLLMFAMTSGTTDASKRIPVTRRFLRDYRAGWQRWGVGVYERFPELPDLNIVQISSSHRRTYSPGGTPCGNISGLVASMQNPIVRSLYTVSADVAEIELQKLKRRMTLMLALADPYVGIFMTANPGTLMQLFQEMSRDPESLIRDVHDGLAAQVPAGMARGSRLRRRLRARRGRAAELAAILKETGRLSPCSVWPRLQVLAAWTGGSASAWLRELREYSSNIPIWDHGLHASEGRMTLPLEPGSSTGVLEIQTHFFEFIPTSEADSSHPVVLEAHELERGGEYYILLTTSSGLCRYHIRDVVRCNGFHGATPLLEFLHKGAHISSISGEKISESQVVQAVQRASESLLTPLLYTMTPVWGTPPGYLLHLQLARPTVSEKLEQFAAAVDEALSVFNEEYREKRASGRLAPVRVSVHPDPIWLRFQESRLRKSGGSPEQYKHPFLMPDPGFEGLFMRSCGAGEALAEPQR
ncbi:MAG: hypothetical protein RL215_697 [Planctomycetota bacterium]